MDNQLTCKFVCVDPKNHYRDLHKTLWKQAFRDHTRKIDYNIPKIFAFFFGPLRKIKPLRVTGGQPVNLPLFFGHFFSGLVFAIFFCFFFFSLRSSLFLRKFVCLGFFSVYLLLTVPFFNVMLFAGHPLFLITSPLLLSFVLFLLNVLNFYSWIHICRSLCLFLLVFLFCISSTLFVMFLVLLLLLHLMHIVFIHFLFLPFFLFLNQQKTKTRKMDF